ncbi:GNAT family N-acetyltransferase [Egbenema bharatensis]|uniref:GNAT family N-acetyltransferase n=1 Tax=Egbenema bharatensis TaxID=3463334 RepID=UPI003A8646F0
MTDSQPTHDFLSPQKRSGERLPSDCVLRPAIYSDQRSLRNLLHHFHQERSPIFRAPSRHGRGSGGRWFGVGVLIALGLHMMQALTSVWAIGLILLLGIGVIVAVMLESSSFTVSEDWQKFWVVEHSGQLIGCAKLCVHKHYSTLYNVLVASGWRGRGIGSHLVRQVTQAAPKPVYLACRPEKVNFYRRLGFQPVPAGTLSPLLRRELELTVQPGILPMVLREEV